MGEAHSGFVSLQFWMLHNGVVSTAGPAAECWPALTTQHAMRVAYAGGGTCMHPPAHAGALGAPRLFWSGAAVALPHCIAMLSSQSNK